MKKHLASFILALFLIFPLLDYTMHPHVYAAEDGPYVVPDLRGASGTDILKEIDEQMNHLYGVDAGPNYYNDFIGDYGPIRYDWLEYDFEREKEGYIENFLLSPVMYNPKNIGPYTYNGRSTKLNNRNDHPSPSDPMGRVKVNYAGAGNKNVPVWGLDASGSWYIDWEYDEAYWFESGWSGYRFNGSYYAPNTPAREVISWKKALDILMRVEPDKYYYYKDNSPFKGIETLSGLPDSILDDLIQEGVDYIWGGKKGADVDFQCMGTGNLKSRSAIHNEGEKPPGGSWREAVLIMLPPTYISWGRGVRFSAQPSNPNQIYALDIPIAPIKMVMSDLSAVFVDPPATASAGDTVILAVKAASMFDKEITADYRWRIDGLAEGEVEFLDSDAEGEIELAAMSVVELSVTFTMPKNDVQAVFEINPADADGIRKVKENGNYDNNIAIHVVKTDGVLLLPENIPPWVLTQELSFTVSSSATLTKDRGTWDGNATGSLDIENDSAEIYNFFAVHDNPPVDEASSTILRTPRITATLDRADFGDDPISGSFAPNNIPLSKMGKVNGDGTVQRDYKWTVTTRDPGPPPTSEKETFYATAQADFDPIRDERVYTFDIYNGLTKLPFIKPLTINPDAPKQPVKELDSGKNREYMFNLAWAGTHYPFGLDNEYQVIRWMCHRHADGSEYGWEAVDGQYERVFIGQSSGTVTWQTVETMKEAYRQDRDNATERKTGKGNYEHAVFATDKLLQEYEWPIKSGYYFNPVGVYKCTVKTTQYKDTDEPTKEHRELVEKIRAAFCYDSSLVYVNTRQEAGKLGDITEAVNRGLLAIEEDFNYTATLLETSLEWADWADDTAKAIDPLFKEVLEGYAESKTAESYETYKYREQTDQVIYRVEEETVVEFTVGIPPEKSHQNLYTHVNMKNGEYLVLTRVNEIEFEFDHYESNGLMKVAAFNLDGIKVTVSGSMYDDR